MQTEVCVVTYCNEATVDALAASLALMDPRPALAVHDNSPGGATLPLVESAARAHGLEFRGERCARDNCGFAAGCNSLAAGTSAQQLLFLNPDAEIHKWPANLAAAGRVVGAAVHGADGQSLHTSGRSRTLRDEMSLRWLRRRPLPPDGQGYVSGAALLIDRADHERLGGFDEGYFMYYEDIDLCLRAGRSGIPVELREDWVVAHAGGASVGTSADGLTRAHLRSYRSGRRFHAEHGHSVRGYDMLCLTDAMLRAALRSTRRGSRPRAAADWAVARAAAAALRAPRT